jgi:hypothetical protein
MASMLPFWTTLAKLRKALVFMVAPGLMGKSLLDGTSVMPSV